MFSAESVSSALLRPRQRNASTFIDEQGRPKVCVLVCVCVCVCAYFDHVTAFKVLYL